MAFANEFTTEVTPLTAAAWSALLTGFADANIYQTMPFGAVRWGSDRLSHLRLTRNGRVVGCAQVAIVRAPMVGTGIAYLRWGPLYRLNDRPADPAVHRAMVAALYEEYALRRRLLVRVAPPCPAADEDGLASGGSFAEGGFRPAAAVKAYRTLMLDLAPPLDALRANLHPGWRNHLNRAERNGLVVRQGTGDDLFGAFAALYGAMLARKRFASSVDVADFRAMQRALGDDLKMQLLICEQQGVPVAGLVVSALGDTGVFLLGATDDGGLTSFASYLLQWHALRWLKERGIRRYDLGGIDPEGNPGVYQFKAGLAGREVTVARGWEACDSLASELAVRSGDAIRHAYAGLRGSLRARS